MISRGLIGAIGLGLAKERAKVRARSVAIQAALIGAAGLFALFVIGFAGFTGYLALVPAVGPVGASAIITTIFALVALALVIAARIEANRVNRAARPLLRSRSRVIHEKARAADDLTREARVLMSRNAPALVLGAFVAGFLAKRR